VSIVENLSKNLVMLLGKRFYLLCLPLPIRDDDGAPARTLTLAP